MKILQENGYCCAFLWIWSGKSATLLFSPLTTNIDSITAAIEDSSRKQISVNIIVTNSPGEVKKSFEQAMFLLKKFKVPKLITLTNRRREKSEIITNSPCKRKL